MTVNDKKLVLKIACLPWFNESRDKRELSVAREMGYDVAVLAKGEDEDHGRMDEVSGFRVYRYSVKPLGRRFPHALNKALSLFTWADFVRRLSPYAISGHDIHGLTIGWISTWFMPKRKRPVLIYDSHELETGRNARRGALTKAFVLYWERFLISQSRFTIMVNDSVADELVKIHGLKERPLVVRSTPEKWSIDRGESARVRSKLLSLMAEPRDFIALYHGVVANGRGIENFIRALAETPDICGVILGNGSDEYLRSLKDLAAEYGVEARLLFHPAVSYAELGSYVSAADLGMVNIMPVSKSYYFCLPNKFFECIQSCTPVLISDFPELRRVVEHYDIGLWCDPEDAGAISACMEKMRTDKALYSRFKNNLGTAKEELCWEKEKKILAGAYASIDED